MKRTIVVGIAVVALWGCGGSIASTAADPLFVLPNRSLTPGVVNGVVTQATIHATICVSGYTSTIRPPVSYTSALKRQQMAEYGYADQNPRDYEEDHLISLELGGAPSDPRNLWPEPGPSPNPKDKLENYLHQRVCVGAMTLSEAQLEISTDWVAAYRRYLG